MNRLSQALRWGGLPSPLSFASRVPAETHNWGCRESGPISSDHQCELWRHYGGRRTIVRRGMSVMTNMVRLYLTPYKLSCKELNNCNSFAMPSCSLQNRYGPQFKDYDHKCSICSNWRCFSALSAASLLFSSSTSANSVINWHEFPPS